VSNALTHGCVKTDVAPAAASSVAIMTGDQGIVAIAARDHKELSTFVCKVGAVGMVGKTPPPALEGRRDHRSGLCAGPTVMVRVRAVFPGRVVPLTKLGDSWDAASPRAPPPSVRDHRPAVPSAMLTGQMRGATHKDGAGEIAALLRQVGNTSAGSGLCPTLYTTASRSLA
jgi:hypothetical protein